MSTFDKEVAVDIAFAKVTVAGGVIDAATLMARGFSDITRVSAGLYLLTRENQAPTPTPPGTHFNGFSWVPNAIFPSTWTADAGATTTVVPLLPATLTPLPVNGFNPRTFGMQARFLGNVTAGLLDVIRPITANTNAQITVAPALPFAPAAGDMFVIEQTPVGGKLPASDILANVSVQNATPRLVTTVDVDELTTAVHTFDGITGAASDSSFTIQINCPAAHEEGL